MTNKIKMITTKTTIRISKKIAAKENNTIMLVHPVVSVPSPLISVAQHCKASLRLSCAAGGVVMMLGLA